MRRPMKFLMAGWDSDGGVEAVQTVVRKAVRRGHEVRVLGPKGCAACSICPAACRATWLISRSTRTQAASISFI